MHLSDHSLRQIDDAYLRSLDLEALCGLSVRLLADLKEARERLNQGPTNSSRPPSSRAPWDRGATGVEPDEAEECSAGSAAPAETPTEAPPEVPPATVKPAPGTRKAGKQPGAPGVGRTQVFAAHETLAHSPEVCTGCGRALTDPVGAVAYTGFQAVDLRCGEPDAPGLRLWVVDHRYYEVPCACGHHTRAEAGRGAVDPLLAGVELSEWRGVGPGLAGLIVALSLRFRLSRARIQEFLGEWLGVELSIGTIHQTLHEAAAALAPAEDEWIDALLASGLLHADETSWPERGQPLWLWVFTAATVTLYSVAGRGKELVENVLDGFTGWLMSDGWVSYRHYPRRLRCWAHLLRKAQGLVESYQGDVRAFGRQVRDALNALMAAVYAAREGPPADLPTQHAHPPDRVARRVRAAPGPSPRQDPCPGGGAAERLGGHLPGVAPSRTPADQQRRGAGPAALGDRPQDQSRHPHRHRLTGLSPCWPASSTPAGNVATRPGPTLQRLSPTGALAAPSHPCRSQGGERLRLKLS